MRYKYILFDFDGTLFDTSEGIKNSLRYAFGKVGYPYKEEELHLFIGPPFISAFKEILGMQDEEAINTKMIYRQYYREKGVYECKPVEGVLECLQKLKSAGYKLAVATSKPEVFAVQILERFKMKDYFDCVVGALPDDTRSEKQEVVRTAMDLLGVKDLSECVMIGDRKYDVLGAKACGIDCIGIRACDFAEEGELEQAGAVAVVQNFNELMQLL